MHTGTAENKFQQHPTYSLNFGLTTTKNWPILAQATFYSAQLGLSRFFSKAIWPGLVLADFLGDKFGPARPG